MMRRGRETKPVSFRMPIDLYEDVAAVARLRDIDLSQFLNGLISQHRPEMRKEIEMAEKERVHCAADELDEKRPVSLKMPMAMWRDVKALARLRGIDVSSIILWCVAEYRPQIVDQIRELTIRPSPASGEAEQEAA